MSKSSGATPAIAPQQILEVTELWLNELEMRLMRDPTPNCPFGEWTETLLSAAEARGIDSRRLSSFANYTQMIRPGSVAGDDYEWIMDEAPVTLAPLRAKLKREVTSTPVGNQNEGKRYTYQQIAKGVGYSKSTISAYVKKAGIVVTQGQCNRTFDLGAIRMIAEAHIATSPRCRDDWNRFISDIEGNVNQ